MCGCDTGYTCTGCREIESERFYILESTGYQINLGSSSRGGGGHARPATEVLVLDRGDMHRVVWSSWVEYPVRSGWGNGSRLDTMRNRAIRVTAKLNSWAKAQP